jgi:hypothetical protein
MWLVTQHGFFNIIQYEEDKPKDILTIKARRWTDLKRLKEDYHLKGTIEISDAADYRYRLKVIRPTVGMIVQSMVHQIDYPKFKSRIIALPEQRDRHGIYLRVWEQLFDLQDTESEHEH